MKMLISNLCALSMVEKGNRYSKYQRTLFRLFFWCLHTTYHVSDNISKAFQAGEILHIDAICFLIIQKTTHSQTKNKDRISVRDLFEITAIDSGSNTASCTVTCTIGDINDNAPVFAATSYK